MTTHPTLRPFRIPSKLARLKMVVAYARALKSMRQAAGPEDTSTTGKAETPEQGKKR